MCDNCNVRASYRLIYASQLIHSPASQMIPRKWDMHALLPKCRGCGFTLQLSTNALALANQRSDSPTSSPDAAQSTKHFRSIAIKPALESATHQSAGSQIDDSAESEALGDRRQSGQYDTQSRSAYHSPTLLTSTARSTESAVSPPTTPEQS
jgi:hypothetical protein